MNNSILSNLVYGELNAFDASVPKFIPGGEAIIREYRPGDEGQILPLFNSVLKNGSAKTLDHFNWQFRNHTQGRGWLTVAEVDGEIVGQHGVMRQHLNYAGREVIAGQGVDLAVSPEHRRKGLSVQMQQFCTNHAHSMGAEIISIFPNRNAYSALIKSCNWFKVAQLKSFSYQFGLKRIGAVGGSKTCYIFGHMDFLKNKIRLSRTRKPKNVRMVDSFSLPDHLTETLLEINCFEVLSFWKDLDYLKWRYENHPTHRYTFHLLILSNKVEGLIVSRNCGDWIAVCEVLHRTKNIEQTTLLLQHVIDYYSRTRAIHIKFLGFDAGFFETVFQAADFAIRPISSILFGVWVFPDSKVGELALLPHNWTISYGDTDYI